ncbi:hypothetical protein KIN20_025691, partial [Parelaphostrongylus tenuis]
MRIKDPNVLHPMENRHENFGNDGGESGRECVISSKEGDHAETAAINIYEDPSVVHKGNRSHMAAT